MINTKHLMTTAFCLLVIFFLTFPKDKSCTNIKTKMRILSETSATVFGDRFNKDFPEFDFSGNIKALFASIHSSIHFYYFSYEFSRHSENTCVLTATYYHGNSGDSDEYRYFFKPL